MAARWSRAIVAQPSLAGRPAIPSVEQTAVDDLDRALASRSCIQPTDLSNAPLETEI